MGKDKMRIGPVPGSDFMPRRSRGGIIPTHPTQSGWCCPNCGGAHGPEVSSCPKPPRNASLADRIKRAGGAFNG